VKVNVIGFELSLAKGIEIPEIYQLLESAQGDEHKHGKDRYIYFTQLLDGIIVGLVLRFKTDKMTIATTKDENGELIIDIKELAKEKDSTEVSLFAINPNTLRGVCYSYLGSLSETILTNIFRKPHDKLKSGNIKSLTEQYSQFGKNDKAAALTKAQGECSGFFSLSILTTPADVDTLLKSYDVITAVEVKSKGAFDKGGKFEPNSNLIKSSKVNVVFENLSSGYTEIVKYIKKLNSGKTIDEVIKLRGKLASGKDKWLEIGENISDFGVLEFDNYVKSLPQDKWTNYTSCEGLKKLIYLLNNKTSIFGNPSNCDNWRLPSAATENSKNKRKESVE